MTQRGTYIEAQEYFKSSAVSQSTLKDVLRGAPVDLNPRSRRDGSIIDAFLTMGGECVSEIYTVVNVPRPSEPVQEIINKLFVYLYSKDRLKPSLTQIRRDAEMFFADSFQNIKDLGKRWEKILTFDSWWGFLYNNLNKEIITENERSYGYEIAEKVKKDPITAPYFQDWPGVDTYYQVPIYFSYLGTECRALPDIVQVSHRKKVILVTDIKTVYLMSRPLIYGQIADLRYPFQGSFYAEAARQKFKDLVSAGYEVKFQWMFISKDMKVGVKTLIIPCSNNILELNKVGFVVERNKIGNSTGSTRFYGWVEAIEFYNQAEKEDAKSYYHIHSGVVNEQEAESNIIFYSCERQRSK